jgi:hypothetical protein
MEKLPAFAYDLVMALNEQYPNADPLVTDTDREVWMRVGKRHLVLNLLSLINSAQDGDGLPDVLSHN